MAAIGREAALYLRLAGASAEPGDRAAIAALAAGVDWDALRGLARRDGTTAAVRRRLLAAGVGPPEEVAAGLAREAGVLDFHRLALDGAVRAATAELAAAGLRVVLLKGAALVGVAYARPIDRPMSDADLLLAPGDANAAARLLRGRGWTPVGADGGAAGARGYESHHHLPPLLAPGGAHAIVELHHDVLPPGHPFAWDGAALAARARPTGVDGALVPECADLLLHACVHFAWSHELRHGAWRTFADVAALLARHGVHGVHGAGGATCGAAGCAGVEAVVERAERIRAATAVAWTLRLAAERAGVRLPPALAAAARRAPGGALLARHLAAELVPGAERAPSILLSRLLWARALRPGRSGHGESRPWRVGATGGGGRATPLPGRAVAQVGRLAAWHRYGRRVLGG